VPKLILPFERVYFAGMPIAFENSGISLFIKEHAPIIQLLPILTLRIVAFTPINVLSPMYAPPEMFTFELI